MAHTPETHYATTDDGVSIAYQTVGDERVDLVLELESWGNVEIMWELEPLADLFERLSQFSRLVLHDRRGTGLSGGRSSFPNLETRVRDLLTVLDSIRSRRVALFGERTGGAALAMFAATYPDRVASFVWFRAIATRRWSPEYPWGRTPDEHRQEAAWTRDGMGNKAFQREWLEGVAPTLAGDEQLEARLARLDRHFMAPSTAVDWINVESETDVRAVLPLLHCRDGRDGSRHRPLHRHRGLDRSAGIHRRPCVGRARRSASRHRPRRARAVARHRERHGWRRLLRDLRRTGACDPVRARRREPHA